MVVSRFDVTPTADPLVWDAVDRLLLGNLRAIARSGPGPALGGGAHLAALRRTAVGPFLLHEAHPLTDLVLLAPVEGVRHLRSGGGGGSGRRGVRHGRVLTEAELGTSLPPATRGPWAVLDTSGALLAVYQRRTATDASSRRWCSLADAG